MFANPIAHHPAILNIGPLGLSTAQVIALCIVIVGVILMRVRAERVGVRERFPVVPSLALLLATGSLQAPRTERVQPTASRVSNAQALSASSALSALSALSARGL